MGHLHLHLVAQIVGAMRAAAAQAIVLLVEHVVVVVEVAQRYHALALVLVNLYVEAKLGDAADGALEGLPEALAHELHLLVLDAGPFGLRCQLLHVGTLVAERFVLVLIDVAASVGIAGEQAVYYQVGIAANGRGEVGVVVECQAVVADVVSAVAGLHHGAQRDHLHYVLLLAPLDLGEHLVEVAAYLGAAAGGLQLVAEPRDKASSQQPGSYSSTEHRRAARRSLCLLQRPANWKTSRKRKTAIELGRTKDISIPPSVSIQQENRQKCFNGTRNSTGLPSTGSLRMNSFSLSVSVLVSWFSSAILFSVFTSSI